MNDNLNDNLVRLLSLEIKNIKNVSYGKINIVNNKQDVGFKSDILGIYGQNGSGKTTVIEVLDILKILISGNALPAKTRDYIMQGLDSAECTITFLINHEEKQFICNYFFKLELVGDSDILVSNEKLSFKDKTDKKISLNYDVRNTNYTITPKYRYNEFIDGDKENKIDLLVAKKMPLKECRSFFFSNEFIGLSHKSNISNLSNILMSLKLFAIRNLFVIKNLYSGIISLDKIIPISFKHKEENSETLGRWAIYQNEPSVYALKEFNVLKEVIESINIVISSLVPGLSLFIKEYGIQTMENGNEGMRFELLSNRKDKLIPLQYESEGIKKILSILNLLIGVYNNENMCVAIDELDAGVFEYLLGEILSILEENGKGQLIFTSHNLRPLEMIHKSSLVFTTTNPENRYIRLANVKNHNNLRDLYLRSISLGGQVEQIYEQTNSFQISHAMRKAGGVINGK